MRLEHPRGGLSVFLSNVFSDRDIMSDYKVGNGAVTITSVLSGSFQHSDEKHGNESPLSLDEPTDMIHQSDGCTGSVCIKGGIPFKSVSIYLEDAVLLEMVEGEPSYASIIEALDVKGEIQLLGRFPSTPQTKIIANQMLDCSYSGPCRKLFMESKALELIATILHKMSCNEERPSISLSAGDIDRLHEARRFLLENMEEPPTIKELARHVGLNDFKLKKGFRAVFGCTPFQALKAHRMDHARTMLLDTDMTVGTVAAMVGYTNMSHFIAAFRNQFGVTPGSLLSHSRHRAVA